MEMVLIGKNKLKTFKMKRITKTLILTFALVSFFTSCEKDSGIKSPYSTEGTEIDVELNAITSKNLTKVSYIPNADKSKFTFAWTAGDEISIIISGVQDNANRKFTTESSDKNSVITGKISTWEGEKDAYAIYPYCKEGYSVANNRILVDNSTQNIDLEENNKFTNGLMVGNVSGATALAERNYNIPDFALKQVMCFFQINLTDITDPITDFGFECNDAVFIQSAYINLTDGNIRTDDCVKTKRVSAKILNQNGSTATINFALLPVNTIGKEIKMFFSTATAKYTKTFTQGLNFTRNSFMVSKADEFSVIEDVDDQGLTLKSFSIGSPLSSDTWVITDTEATSYDFFDLEYSISQLSNERNISLVFPNLKEIPNNAFNNLYNNDKCALKSVSFPNAKKIGYSAFYNCSSLTTVDFPLVTNISYNAFENCSSLTTVDFPLVTEIDYRTFYNCSSLTTVDFPLVTEIGKEAFKNCSSLTSVNFPIANKIKESAFSNCTTLKSVYCPDVFVIESLAFFSCSSLTTVDFPRATFIATDYHYGSRILHSSAFSYCTSLISASFPSATKVENLLFSGCTALESVSFPNAKEIGEEAFENCSSLTTIDFPRVTEIGRGSFYGCSALNSVSFPLVTTALDYSRNPPTYSDGNGAFENCSSLTTVDFPLVTEIGEYAFENCSSLTTVDFPRVTEIGREAFSDCSSLTAVNIPLATVIKYGAFYNCSSLTTVDFPLVTGIGIGADAFNNCSSLTTVDFPLVTRIGAEAFYNCSSLTTVDFPLVTVIYKYAFENCSSLCAASFPSATSIYRGAFIYCKSLTSLELATKDDAKLTLLGTRVFDLSDGKTTQASKITLTIGAANSDYISGDTIRNAPTTRSVLPLPGIDDDHGIATYIFKQIIITK